MNLADDSQQGSQQPSQGRNTEGFATPVLPASTQKIVRRAKGAVGQAPPAMKRQREGTGQQRKEIKEKEGRQREEMERQMDGLREQFKGLMDILARPKIQSCPNQNTQKRRDRFRILGVHPAGQICHGMHGREEVAMRATLYILFSISYFRSPAQ